MKYATKIRVDASGCWLWIAGRSSSGYGVAWIGNGRSRSASRAVWLELRGPIPEGLELDHLCRNRACVNPDHLEPVTHAVNVQRQPSKQRCKRGHEFAGKRTRETGGRYCTECNKINKRLWRARTGKH